MVFAKQNNSIAVVTGVDNGIGAGYAKRMAEQGLDVVLIGENKIQLQTLAKDIGNELHCCEIPIDFNCFFFHFLFRK